MGIVLQTNDFDELSEAQQSWDIRYRPLETGAFKSTLAVNATDHCQIDFETWNQSIEMFGTAPEDAYGFCLPAYKDRKFSSRGVTADDDQLLCLRPGAEIHTVTGNVVALVAVAIDAEYLELQCGSAVGELLGKNTDQQTLLQFDANELQPIQNILLSAAREDEAGWPHKALWARDEIVRHLTDLLLKEAAFSLKPERSNQYALARQARDIMLANIYEPPLLSDLCQQLGTSERTLFYAFRTVFGTSPKAFLKRQRLSATRNAIKYLSEEQSIAEVMTRYGFFDAGHFAKDYKEMFGELPTKTRNRYMH